MVKTKKGDFIELDFVARIKEGNIFDTTIKEEAEKAGMLKKEEEEQKKRIFEPFRLCIGQEMILHGLDVKLVDKELGKEYEIELEPKEAFGKRNPKLIKTFSLGSFIKKGMMPSPGEFVNIDNMIAKIISVSGGRVVSDFNNPLADKIIIYKIKINKIITEEKEKIEAIAKFYFANYEIKEEKNKFNLFVKEKKLELVEKKIKEVLPGLEISYQS
jgi:peptidylprolyl isomerase